VESNLKTDPELASAGIQVSAKNYTVVLTGRVTSKEARQKAEDLARRVEGVTEVENKIEVVPAP
jgi:osmotically-inducible protein OsmY